VAVTVTGGKEGRREGEKGKGMGRPMTMIGQPLHA